MINLSPMVITLHLVKEDTAFPGGGRGDEVLVQQTQDVWANVFQLLLNLQPQQNSMNIKPYKDDDKKCFHYTLMI